MVERESPALHIQVNGPGAMIALRLDPGDTRAMTGIRHVLGTALPQQGVCLTAGEVVVLGLAFDEWLLLAPADAQVGMIRRLQAALAGCHAAIVDASDLRTVFGLRGAHAWDVLRKGCAVDLHPRAFATGDCVQTAFARVRVILRQLDDTPAYELLVERSYAAYMKDWLDDAAREFTAASS